MTTELQRVLAECDELGKSALGARYQIALGDAARLLRSLAADFNEYADHGLDTRGRNCRWVSPGASGGCTCGLDVARAKWRLEP